MIPKGLNRRLDQIRRADNMLAKARHMAYQFRCVEAGERTIGEEFQFDGYEWSLLEAAKHYDAAGLGLLSRRVADMAARPVSAAWTKFDRINATTGV